MKTLINLLSFLWLTVSAVSAQKHDHNWYFGYRAGLNFHTSLPAPQAGKLRANEGVASISDAAGQLLFYTDGIEVYDRNHNLMPNGDDLAGGESSAQTIIVPQPGSAFLYYIFTVKDHETPGAMSYSIVDMRLHDGFGDIILSSKNSLLVNNTREQLTAIPHENNHDIWIITHGLYTNRFYAYLLTVDGIIDAPIISEIGFQSPETFGAHTSLLKSSHAGRQIVSNIPYLNTSEIFDFDRQSGIISNARTIQLGAIDAKPFGVEFSPNDSLLYITITEGPGYNLILQVDMFTAGMPYDTIRMDSSKSSLQYGSVQKGPDNKIYIAHSGGNFLGVIHEPNKKGDLCNYVNHGVILLENTTSGYGLPQKIIISDCPAPDLGPDLFICLGDSVKLIAPWEQTIECPFTFQWFDGSIDSVKYIKASGTYWVEIQTESSAYRDSLNIQVGSEILSSVDAEVCNGELFEGYANTGVFVDTFQSSFGCDSIRTLNLVVHDVPHTETDIYILEGDSYQNYFETGIYVDTLETVQGCDSIRTLHLTVLEESQIISYNMNACESVMAYGTHMDYSEFTPQYPQALECATVTAGTVHREFPEKHSCTTGLAYAMCVSIPDTCDYIPGHSASVVIEFTIDPPPGSAVQLTNFTFWENSPDTYTWINGPYGPNQGPAYYGIRILKNGIEIFRDPDRITQNTWHPVGFTFTQDTLFRCDTISHFVIELLPYCPTGPDADVKVWDVDQFDIYATCIPLHQEVTSVSGHVRTPAGEGIPNVRVDISSTSTFENARSVMTNNSGVFEFDHLEKDRNYFIRCERNDDILRDINVMDLLKIRKYLLGMEAISDEADRIAADVDRNQQISVLDLVALQKALLGKIFKFPNNTSWRFAPVPEIPGDLMVFEKEIFIENLSGLVDTLEFTGVKIGDVHRD